MQEIVPGDIVLSYNEQTQAVEPKRVVQTFVRQTDRIYRAHYSNGAEFETTFNHVFYVEGEGWVQAKQLRAGDVSLLASGGQQLISGVNAEARYETVYNFEVQDNHTYFVGRDAALMHNQNIYRTALLAFTGQSFSDAEIRDTYGAAGLERYQMMQIMGRELMYPRIHSLMLQGANFEEALRQTVTEMSGLLSSLDQAALLGISDGIGSRYSDNSRNTVLGLAVLNALTHRGGGAFARSGAAPTVGVIAAEEAAAAGRAANREYALGGQSTSSGPSAS
ncbi:MAG: HINT domain-containing protein [Leptospirales bacterium]|nr:HINT domain-containing protein [Leptospirales bacterium]